jgi:two-component system CheB/CheR fusion protein
LDNDLKVRRSITQATKINKLIASDVGRPITDPASELFHSELTADAQEVLQKLGISEKPITLREGRWFTVRIMPYRTLDDRIDGVVITFADFTTTETLEAQLREKRAALERQVAKQPLDTDPSREKVTATPAAGFPTKNCHLFSYSVVFALKCCLR